MVTLVALVDVHVKVDEPPDAIVVGDALIDTVGTGAVAFTVTVADDVTDPTEFVAVSVYVVVAVGDTLRLPDAATVPIPWLMVTDVAFAVLHVSVDDCPELMVVGDADSEAVGSELTVTVAVSVSLPLELVAVIV